MGGRGASAGGSAGGGSGGGSLKLGSPTEQRDDYTKAEKKALTDYTLSSHVNKELATVGYDNMTGQYKDMVDKLDSAIAKSGWNKTEYNTGFMRGGGGSMIGIPKSKSFATEQEKVDYINNNLLGKDATNAGYTSMTRTQRVAEGFAKWKKNPVILNYIEIDKGTRGAYVSGGKGKTALSTFGVGEDETLVGRGLKTIPVRAYVKGGITWVDVIADPGKK